MKDTTKEKIKDFLKSLPEDTKISLENYLKEKGYTFEQINVEEKYNW